MKPGEPDYMQIVRFLQIFLREPTLARSRNKLIRQLSASPPRWLIDATPEGQLINPAYVTQVEAVQCLYPLAQCVAQLTEAMLAVAQSRYAPHHCSVVHASSTTLYPFHKEISLPTKLIRVGNLAGIGLWEERLGLEAITLHGGVSRLSHHAVAHLGLAFRKADHLTIVTIDLDGHVVTHDFKPHVVEDRLLDFSLGIEPARNIFGMRRVPYKRPASGIEESFRDPQWLAERLPELASMVHKLAGDP